MLSALYFIPSIYLVWHCFPLLLRLREDLNHKYVNKQNIGRGITLKTLDPERFKVNSLLAETLLNDGSARGSLLEYAAF